MGKAVALPEGKLTFKKAVKEQVPALVGHLAVTS